MKVVRKQINGTHMEAVISSSSEEYRVLSGESTEAAVQILFNRFLADGKLRVIGRPAVKSVSCPDGKTLTFSVEAELYPSVRLGKYRNIHVAAKRDRDETAFIHQVLQKACENMEAEISDEMVRQRLDAMIAGEKLRVSQDSIYYLLADTTEVLGEVYKMAGCVRPPVQVREEALDILLQAVSSDNKGPELPFLKQQMTGMAARYANLPEDFDELVESAFERRKKKKGKMSGEDVAEEAFEAYLGTLGLNGEILRRERKPEAEAAVRCDLLFDAVAAAEKLELSEKELEEECRKLAACYGLDAEELGSAIDREALSGKLLRDKACALILDSAEGGF